MNDSYIRRVMRAFGVLGSILPGLVVLSGAWECSASAGEDERESERDASAEVAGVTWEALFTASEWERPEFLERWQPPDAPTRLMHRRLEEPPMVFGVKPHAVTGFFDGGRLKNVTILFLDSGTHFGYVAPEDAGKYADRRREFDALYETSATTVREGLQRLSGQAGESLILGQELLLRREVTVFPVGALFGRLTEMENQLIKLTLFRDREDAVSLLSEEARSAEKERDRWEALAANVHTEEDGDRILDGIPMMPQGDRAYCGVSALSMAMQYLGLMLDTEDYAAAAGIQYGTTKGSMIKEVYGAAGEEAGLRLSRTTRFDYERTRACIDEGFPVIVWRRWRKDRDYLHTTFARRLAEDPGVELPVVDADDRELWPTEEDYNHASVITGYNAQRGEVIFTESWGESVRNRRMRVEEMEGTSYYTFYPRP